MADKWMGAAVKSRGDTHRQLGVPRGKKKAAVKLAKSSNPTEAKRARLAEVLKRMSPA